VGNDEPPIHSIITDEHFLQLLGARLTGEDKHMHNIALGVLGDLMILFPDVLSLDRAILPNALIEGLNNEHMESGAKLQIVEIIKTLLDAFDDDERMRQRLLLGMEARPQQNVSSTNAFFTALTSSQNKVLQKYQNEFFRTHFDKLLLPFDSIADPKCEFSFSSGGYHIERN